MKTRFCPSPTGYMHLGNVRTALFNFLLAQGQGGHFLLRIEDTDHARSSTEYDQILQADLHWLGLVWQEGPQVGGDHAPYYQSQRQTIYDQYYQQLEQTGLAYPCFCTDEQLNLTRKIQLSSGQAPRYAGTCLNLTTEQRTARYQQGLPASLRFKVPKNQWIEFIDLVKGPQRFNSDDIGDFIIRRGDGTASFLFCNAIDDALMGVTHALRGEDHLTNTPRQLLLSQALGLSAPQYGHISLILAKNGNPLSKREGSRSIKELREQGFLPAAIVNYLARLGHYYETNAWMDVPTLAAHFSPPHLGTSPAKFDPDQLLYWQKEAIQQLTENEVWQWLGDKVAGLVPEQSRSGFVGAIRHNIAFPADAAHFAQLFFADTLHYSEAAQSILRTVPTTYFSLAQQIVGQQGCNYALLIAELKDKLQLNGKALFQPLRVALTGEMQGPQIEPIMAVLGKEKILARLATAQALLS